MRISVIGCGYLGAVHAACMADLGHEVVAIDTDPEKIALLAAGRVTMHEPGFAELLQRALASGRLRFETDMTTVKDAQMHFVCVGTPQVADGHGVDLGQVDAAVNALCDVLEPGETKHVVVGKSTVPVGTAERLLERLNNCGATLVWNPEFLREGYAIQDTMAPDRIVYGLPEGPDGDYAREQLDEVYADQLRRGITRFTTDFATAELVKTSANSFLATKISFINAVAQVCDAAGADVKQLAKMIGVDDRIGKKFLQAGIGFGGGCLPKDLRGFSARAEELGATGVVDLMHNVDQINTGARDRVVELTRTALGDSLAGARVAVLGAAFKPYSDDIRDSPAIAVAQRLRNAGADVVMMDPAASGRVAAAHPELTCGTDLDLALKGADAVVLATEWREFVVLDPHTTGELVARKVMIDGRNVLEPARWRAAGWDYYGMGRR